MTISNHERVGRVLDLLREGLYPFVEREMHSQCIKGYFISCSLLCTTTQN